MQYCTYVQFAEWCLNADRHPCPQADNPYSLFEGTAAYVCGVCVLHLYLYVRMCRCMNVCVWVCVCNTHYMHVCVTVTVWEMCICLCVYVYDYAYLFVHTCTYVRNCVWMRICVCVYMCSCVYACGMHMCRYVAVCSVMSVCCLFCCTLDCTVRSATLCVMCRYGRYPLLLCRPVGERRLCMFSRSWGVAWLSMHYVTIASGVHR